MKRFPDYYMFRLTEEEWNNWKSQFVTSNYMSEDEIQAIKMGVRRPPFAFTDQEWHMLMPSGLTKALSTSLNFYLDMANKGVKAPSAKQLRMMSALGQLFGGKEL